MILIMIIVIIMMIVTVITITAITKKNVLFVYKNYTSEYYNPIFLNLKKKSNKICTFVRTYHRTLHIKF